MLLSGGVAQAKHVGSPYSPLPSVKTRSTLQNVQEENTELQLDVHSIETPLDEGAACFLQRLQDGQHTDRQAGTTTSSCVYYITSVYSLTFIHTVFKIVYVMGKVRWLR